MKKISIMPMELSSVQQNAQFVNLHLGLQQIKISSFPIALEQVSKLLKLINSTNSSKVLKRISPGLLNIFYHFQKKSKAAS
jgi:hypothetical protein